MTEPKEGILLRVFINEKATYEGALLYEAIIVKAKKMSIYSAAVIRGVMGYLAPGGIQDSKTLRLSENMPVVVELCDETEKIEAFLPIVREMAKEGLVSSQKISIFK